MARKKTEKVYYQIRPDYRDVIVKGLVIANYKEFCELMDVEVTTGNAKLAQFKEWERHFSYTKQGNSFVITEVYDTPLEKTDAREENGSIYAKHIETILLNIINVADTKEMTYTEKHWLEMIGMYNDKFSSMEKDYKERSIWATQNDVREPELNDFIQKTLKNLGDSFKAVLGKLEKRSLISYSNVAMYNLTSDAFGSELRTTDRYEYDQYREIERDVLQFFKAESIGDLYFKYDSESKKMFDIRKYYKKLNAEIEKKLGWRFHFKAISILSTPRQISSCLNKDEIREEVTRLNNKVSKQTLKQALKRHEENIDYTIRCDEEVNFFTITGETEIPHSIWDYKNQYGNKYFYGKEDYVENIEKMTTDLIIS